MLYLRLYRTYKVSLEAFRAIEAALVKYDNKMEGLFPGG